MAGSMSWQVYRTDAGQNYAIFMDKSNALAVNASASTTPQNLPIVAVPRNIRPRYALFRSDDGLTTRKVVLLTPADVSALSPGESFTTDPGGVVVKLQSTAGERIRLPKQVDTGLTT